MTERKIVSEYTRGIQKEFNKILFQNVKMTDWKMELSPIDAENANDYLVWIMYWLTPEEVSAMNAKEYETLLVEVGKLQTSQVNG